MTAESVRVDLRITPELKEQLATLAARERRSINAQLVTILAKALEGDSK